MAKVPNINIAENFNRLSRAHVDPCRNRRSHRIFFSASRRRWKKIWLGRLSLAG